MFQNTSVPNLLQRKVAAVLHLRSLLLGQSRIQHQSCLQNLRVDCDASDALLTDWLHGQFVR